MFQSRGGKWPESERLLQARVITRDPCCGVRGWCVSGYVWMMEGVWGVLKVVGVCGWCVWVRVDDGGCDGFGECVGGDIYKKVVENLTRKDSYEMCLP